MRLSKHYTLTINKPCGPMKARIEACPHFTKVTGTEQYVLWDGPAYPLDIMRLWATISPDDCTGAALFRGKPERQAIVRTFGTWEK